MRITKQACESACLPSNRKRCFNTGQSCRTLYKRRYQRNAERAVKRVTPARDQRLATVRALVNHRDLLVVTNTCNVVDILIDQPSIEVIAAGGRPPVRIAELDAINHFVTDRLDDDALAAACAEAGETSMD